MAILQQVEVLPPHLQEDLALGVELERLFERFFDLVLVIVLVVMVVIVVVVVVVVVFVMAHRHGLPCLRVEAGR